MTTAKCEGEEKVYLKDHQCYPFVDEKTMNNIESTLLRSSVTTANNNNEIAGAVSAGASASSSFASSPTDASSVCVDTTDAEQQVKSLYFSHEASLEMHAPTDDPPRWGEEMDDDLLNMFDDIDNLDHPIFGGGYVVATSDGQLKEFYSHPKAFNKKEGEPPSFLDINAHPQDSLQVDVKPSASEEASPNNHIFDDSFTLGDMPHVSQSHSQDNDGLDTSFNERGNVFDNGPVFYDNVDDTTGEGFSSTDDYTETLLLQESICTTSLPPLMLRTLPESQDIPQAQGDHQVTPLLGEAKCDSLPIVTPVTLTSVELKSGELNKGTLPQSKVSSLPLSMSQKSSNGLHQRSNGNSCINDNAVAPTPRGQGKEHQAQRHDVTWKRRFAELEEFKLQHGHCNVPQGYDKNTKLGAWVSRQRLMMRTWDEKHEADKGISCSDSDGNAYSQGDRVQQLKDLGLESFVGKGVFGKVNTSTASMWEKKFNDLIKYRDENGNCDVPTKKSSLGRWVANQRKQYRDYDYNAGKNQSNDDARAKELHNRYEKLKDAGFKFSIGKGKYCTKLPKS